MSPPFVTGLDDTWDTKSSHRNVRFTQKGAGSDNNICLIKLCFCKSWNRAKYGIHILGNREGYYSF